VIRRLLIANRGEIAVRIMASCRELGIEAVAVYSEADRQARHVLEADRSVLVGPAPAAESYLSIPAVVGAARDVGADAVHPGYGFLSENADFAAACEEAGMRFIGPPATVIARMGSKVEARRLMESAGVPVVPGATPDDQSGPGLRRAIDRVGLPVLIKASEGGGGKGMRRVGAESDIDDAIHAARREAEAAFGDGTLYVERMVDRARHVEVQILADGHGRVVHLFERDCSTQRRHQKVIEESPSPTLDAGLRTAMVEAAVRAASAANYVNAGTIEFLVDADRAAFYFLEMNTRLQVEHPVTELVTGVDLVHAQIRIAQGEPLPWTQEQVGRRGHAIEARIYAEDPARGFLPQAGRLLMYREPRVPGVRIDSGVAEGDEISVHYDPLLAKVIAAGETRSQAIHRLATALRNFPILGVRTNLGLLLAVLADPRFERGEVDTSYLDREGTHLGDEPDAEEPPFVRRVMDAYRNAGGRSATFTSRAVSDPWQRLRSWRG
jgi:acetyl-CoA carboxylase biotin carboxylase subunit